MHRTPGQNAKFFHSMIEQLQIQADALAAAADGIAIADRSGRVLWVNPAFTQITGYPPAEVTAESFRWIETAGKSQPEIQSMWETIRSGKTWRGELTRHRKDGSIYYDQESIAPMRADGGEVSHLIVLIQDITSRKQREMELEAVVNVANVLREAHTQAEMLPAVLDRVVQLLDASGAA
ncbi:MAG: PAS domain-containing protein, partial [Omnitrophica WOR_2 bacterium]